jgi:hypothetical protein
LVERSGGNPVKKISFLISTTLLLNLLAACAGNGAPPTADLNAVATIVAGTLSAVPTNTSLPTETSVPQAGSTPSIQCTGHLTGILLTMPNSSWNCSNFISESEREGVAVSSQVFDIKITHHVGRGLFCDPNISQECVVTPFYENDMVKLDLYTSSGENKEILGHIPRSGGDILISIKYLNMETRDLTETERDELVQFIDSIILPASTTSTFDRGSDINWVVFHDPNLQIKFEYPEGWSFTPALEVEKGGAIIIVSPVDVVGKSYNINIGKYLNETISPDENLLDWTTAYDQKDGMIDPSDRIISSRESMKISGLDAVYTVMSYPEVRYVNIRRDDKVLFIWANIGESADAFYQNIYSHILMSFVSD